MYPSFLFYLLILNILYTLFITWFVISIAFSTIRYFYHNKKHDGKRAALLSGLLYTVGVFTLIYQIGETLGIADQYRSRHDDILSPYQYYFADFRHLVEPLFEFFTAFTLLYLFYLLSMKAIEEQKKKRKDIERKQRLIKGEGEVTDSIMNEL